MLLINAQKGCDHILPDHLDELELCIGSGYNNFSMNRGSFNYKQKIIKKIKLIKTGKESANGSTILSYKEPKGNAEHKLELKELGDGYMRIAYIPSPDEDRFNRFWLSFKTNPSEHIYGCGETYSKFDLKGEKVRIFVAEHQNAKRIGRKLIKEKLLGKHPNSTLPFGKYESYYAQPTFTSSDKYFFHADLSSYSEFDFSIPERITIYSQEPPVIYIRKADSFSALSGYLANLLGHQPLLPDWVYEGAIMAVQEGPQKIDEKIKKARDKGVKLCGIWSQDWCGCRRTGFGYQVMWNWQWDKELYCDLDKKIPEWKAQGIRFLGYINPFIAIEGELYKTATQKGYCVKDKDGKDYLVTITTFPAAMVDLTNPEAYDWYKTLIKENMIGIGMGGWMADFGEYLPMDCVLFSGEDPQKVHNRWPAIWAKLNREAIDECGVSGDIFFFTRAGHTETVKYSSMMWTGDQHVDWSIDDGIGSVIPATLSLAMSGYGLTHSDVGGYTTIMHMTRSKELLMRWEEMNIFSPLYRSHEGNQPSRNVQFDDDDELLMHLAKASGIHARLSDYLKKCVADNSEYALPVMRPLFYHYDEPHAYTEKTEYLLGRDILVAPVLKKGAVSRTVCLPEDEWVHLFTKKEYHGGSFQIDSEIGCPPVFIRKKSDNYSELINIATIN